MASLPKCAQSDLRLLPWQGAQSQIGLARRARAQPRHDRAEVIGRAGVAASAHHRVEARGAQRRILRERLGDEGQVRLDDRGAHRARGQRHPGLREHAPHR